MALSVAVRELDYHVNLIRMLLDLMYKFNSNIDSALIYVTV